MGASRRTGTAARVGAGAAQIDDDAPISLSGSDAGISGAANDFHNTNTVGGLSCGGVACPFAPSPIKPCCTEEADVAGGAARAVERCGLDLSLTTSPTAGELCWQRDQLGVLDSACPSMISLGGVEEAGCCTEQGRCGTHNVGQAIGCHYNGGVDAPCGQEEIDETMECEVAGTYAIRVDVDVTWGGRSGGLAALTDDGRGLISIHLKASIDEVTDDNQMVGTMEVCGVKLPAFYSTTLCESYAPLFPTTIWESDKLPKIPLRGSFGCRNPGCAMNFDAQTVLLGISLDNPEAPWPTPLETGTLECPEGMGEECFPDADDDGLPGMTVEVLTSGDAPPGTGCDGKYTQEGAPLSENPLAILDAVRRADRILLGTRTKLGGVGRIGDDCSSGSGAGLAEFVQSRAWGCLIQPGTYDFGNRPAGRNDPCYANEAQFMDENLPIYYILAPGETPASDLKLLNHEPSEGPVSSVVRVADANASVSCGDVRTALP